MASGFDDRGEVPQQIAATIHTRSGPIPLAEFSEFFYLFRVTYSAALESLLASGMSPERAEQENILYLAAITRSYLENLSRNDIERLANRPIPVEPSILQIHRENPIEIIFGGLAILFGVAVVVSGGKFEIGKDGMKVELPPLGEGIAKL